MARFYDIGDFKVEVKPDMEGFTYKGDTECPHAHIVYRETGRIVECGDCKKQIEPWYVFLRIVKRFQAIKQRLDFERETLEKDKATALIHTAALRVQDAWRRHKYVPTCPHCYRGILPEDRFGSSGSARKGKGEKPLVMKPRLKLVTPSKP